MFFLVDPEQISVVSTITNQKKKKKKKGGGGSSDHFHTFSPSILTFPPHFFPIFPCLSFPVRSPKISQ